MRLKVILFYSLFFIICSYSYKSNAKNLKPLENTFITFGKEWIGGGGLIENEFVMVWESRSQWIAPCLSEVNPCQFSQEQYAHLINLPLNLEYPSLLFRSFQQEPRLAQMALAPEFLLAVTSTPKLQIYINTDLLYGPSEDPLKYRGIPRPIRNLYEALLIYHGLNIEESLQISTKIANYWGQQMLIHDLGQIGRPQLSVSYFANEPFKIFLNDDISMFDLTDWFQRSLPCNGLLIQKVQYLKNTYWSNIEFVGDLLHSRLSGFVIYSCGENIIKKYKAEFNLSLYFQQRLNNLNLYELIQNKIQLQTFYREELNN